MIYPARKHILKTFSKLIDILPIQEQSNPQIIVLAGAQTPFRNDTDRELPFRQESNFLYLSGCHVPGSFLLGVHNKDGVHSELFIPKADTMDIMWSVPPPDLPLARQTHDVSKVSYSADLESILQKLLETYPEALIHTLPRNSPLFPNLPDKYTEFKGQPGITDAFLLKSLHLARLIKTEEEVELIRKANAISSRAHEVVMKVLGLGVRGAGKERKEEGKIVMPGEWLIEKEAEAEALFVACCRREGSTSQAYLPIVASSVRASTLHYCCNDREFAWGPVSVSDHHNAGDLTNIRGNGLAHDEGGRRELEPQVLLIDAGCEWGCYASDITRTMPVGNGGKFTEESRAIYELVLEMQKRALSVIKPGIHWDEVHFECHKTLVDGFLRLGIFKAEYEEEQRELLENGVGAAFFPHGLGHSLGLDVHDVPSASKPDLNPSLEGKKLKGHEKLYDYLRLRLVLQEGMVVTVEPGIYFHPHLLTSIRNSPYIDHEVLRKYELGEGVKRGGVGGVRIEDVIVVRRNGWENLTTVGSERAWVERACSGET